MQENISTQMRKGIMEYCLLIVLSRRRVYPSEIVAALKASGLEVKEATVYTVLNRLLKDGKVVYQWQESTQGPPRKYFSITPAGLETLRLTEEVWLSMVRTINSLKNI